MVIYEFGQQEHVNLSSLIMTDIISRKIIEHLSLYQNSKTVIYEHCSLKVPSLAPPERKKKRNSGHHSELNI